MVELWRLPAAEIAGRVRKREISAVEATEAALGRIASVNPKTNAVVQEFPEEALSAARRIDEQIARGEEVGSLAGVPVVIKVNTDQAGHATTNGLRLQKDLIAREDNPVVANLRKAGAIIVGRANTPAFSLRWFVRNSLHGHTLNPHNRAITPGGSSGGSASAVASGMAAIGHATDIAGSIRYPAYSCGLHGLRPSLGRIPAMNFTAPDRHIGGQLMATSGPVARSIGDLRLGYAAMAKEDVRDPWFIPARHEGPDSRKRTALCVAPEGLKVAPEVERALLDAASRLKDAGWEVVETDCPPLREAVGIQLMLWLSEFRRGGGRMIAEEADPDSTFVYAQMEKLCPQPSLDAFMDALQSRARLVREWQLFLQDFPVLLCPVSGELPFPDLLDVESPEAFLRAWEAQLTQIGLPVLGLPAMTVTTSVASRQPVGVQLVAGRYREDLLFKAGAAIAERGDELTPVEPNW